MSWILRPKLIGLAKVRSCSHSASGKQKQVLEAARRLSDEGTKPFKLAQIVAALPELNAGTVRTHVSSRCCVNSPKHHQHCWPYFHRVGRGVYRLRAPFVSPQSTE